MSFSSPVFWPPINSSFSVPRIHPSETQFFCLQQGIILQELRQHTTLVMKVRFQALKVPVLAGKVVGFIFVRCDPLFFSFSRNFGPQFRSCWFSHTTCKSWTQVTRRTCTWGVTSLPGCPEQFLLDVGLILALRLHRRLLIKRSSQAYSAHIPFFRLQ